MPDTSVSISFGIFDISAKAEAMYTGEHLQPFGDFEILRGNFHQGELYATGELNRWLLNGDRLAPPDELGDGNWNLLSLETAEESRSFTNVPLLKASFDEPHTSAGLTLVGDERVGTWCTHVRVTWTGEAGNILAEKDFHPDAATYYIDHLVNNYYGVELRFLETNKPHSFAALSRLDYGLQHIFDESELQRAEIVSEISPIAECLPIGELNFTAISRNEAFNVLNPHGIFASLQTGQVIIADCTVEGIPRRLGYYYLNDWQEKDSVKIDFKCVDTIGMMEREECEGGIFAEQTLNSIIEELFGGKGYHFRIRPEVGEMILSGWIPYTTCREALQMVVFAAGATALVSREDGAIEIANQNKTVRAVIRDERRIMGQTVSKRKLVSNSEVTAFHFTLEEEVKQVWEEHREPGEYFVVLPNPTTDIEVTGAQLTASSANHAVITVTRAGEVVITGREYTFKKSLYRETGKNFLMNGFRNVVAADANALISSTTAQLVATRIIDYYSSGMNMTFRCPSAAEKPGDFIRVYAAKQMLVDGIITKMTVNLIGLIADLEIVGDTTAVTDYEDFQRVNTFRAGVRNL